MTPYAMPRQRGAVLIISLIMLAVMSMFVISMLKTSILELKIGGASHVAALNFANAEYALNKWISDNNGRIAPNFLGLTPTGLAGSNCNVNTVGAGQCTDPPTVFGGTVALTPTQVHCGLSSEFGTDVNNALSAVRIDVRAVATGTLGGTTIIHQGVESKAPPGACS
jgi:Tfp pilus assembly protein PilX